MNDPGKIQGNKLSDLFKYLIEKRVIISMHIVGTGFERLTCITGLMESAQERSLLVDLPDGFKTSAEKTDGLILRFNFNGPDQLEYIFTTQGGRYGDRELHIPFPDYVERLQRRKNFRMETPVGTKMLFNIGKTKAILSLINISMGGVFGALIKHSAKEFKGSLLKADQRILNAGIIFPADNEREELIIIIKKSEVRRVEHDKERNLYKYAFEFMDIDPKEKRKLTQSIYHIQRQFLQRR